MIQVYYFMGSDLVQAYCAGDLNKIDLFVILIHVHTLFFSLCKLDLFVVAV
jgi:hypothetical protein